MRRSIAALAVLIVTQSLAAASLAQGTVGAAFDSSGRAGAVHVQTGTIGWVDHATMNIVCQDRSESRMYWVTRATRYSSPGRPNASFFDLSPGLPVEVISHDSGRFEIANVIRF